MAEKPAADRKKPAKVALKSFFSHPDRDENMIVGGPPAPTDAVIAPVRKPGMTPHAGLILNFTGLIRSENVAYPATRQPRQSRIT